MEKTLQEQAKIVKERLHYHFGKVDGKWFLPNNKMPFMYEFLSEVDRLCALADSSNESSGLNKPVVTVRSEQSCLNCYYLKSCADSISDGEYKCDDYR